MSLKENNLLQAVETAQKLFARGEFRKTEHICRDILRKDAENAEAHLILGVIADKTGNPEYAVRLIGKAIAKHRAELYNLATLATPMPTLASMIVP